MVFSSLIFLFVFLVSNLIIYLLIDKKYKNKVLLIFSLIFYAWGGPKYLILLVGETFASWFFALKIQHSKNKRSRKLYMLGECIIYCFSVITWIFQIFSLFHGKFPGFIWSPGCDS